MKRQIPFGLALAGLAMSAALGFAQIERLDLPQMATKADNAVRGRIVAREVVRIDHPVDGPELYFTHLTVEGTSLFDGKPISVPVTFAGGFVTPEQGTHNSEAPSADEIKLGNEVVVFYKWSDNMGGDLAANALYASHGGIYRVAKTRKGEIALGKGDGYAISANIAVTDLKAQIAQARTK
jgi:hypothetical protein